MMHTDRPVGPVGRALCEAAARSTTIPATKRRRRADVRTRNRPDARLRRRFAKKTYKKTKRQRSNPALFQSPKKPSQYQGHRAVTSDRSGNSISILIGAALIAAAILLSTLITALGTRFVGIENPSDENVWLIDRLTGNVYKCQTPERGKAVCEHETATGSIGERPKR
jgi:hypothetical protein